MARILSIDYGTQRCGLAVTDPLQIIASPAGYVITPNLFSHLKEYFSKEAVERIVVGYPLKADGSVTDATPAVDTFVAKARKQFPDKEIVLYDEYATSKEAVRALLAGGIKKKKRREKGRIDEMSATLILKNYLASDL